MEIGIFELVTSFPIPSFPNPDILIFLSSLDFRLKRSGMTNFCRFIMENYDICIIGAGPGGTAAASEASSLGAKVALVESHDLGGICLNRGCIPTKARLKSASLFEEMKRAGEFGLSAASPEIDVAAIKRRSSDVVNRLRDYLERDLKARKIDIIKGRAVFRDKNTVEIEGESVKAKSFVIACGSSPKTLATFESDLKNIFYSEEILNLDTIPEHVAIIGAGPIGCEFASFFAAFGSEVRLIEMMDRILPAEDKDISNRLEGILKTKGIRVEAGASGIAAASIINQASSMSEVILISVGRLPNTQGLGLENAGVKVHEGRIVADNYLRTSADNIFAAGDCVGRYNLAHAASAEGRRAAANALGKIIQMDYSLMPMCIYTLPEAASVGLNVEQAKEKGHESISSRVYFAGMGKAQANGEPEGFFKLVADGSTGKILGAQILGYNASEVIGIVSVALKGALTASQLADAIQAHPSLGECVQEAARAIAKKIK